MFKSDTWRLVIYSPTLGLSYQQLLDLTENLSRSRKIRVVGSM
jgi:hypothetical protein